MRRQHAQLELGEESPLERIRAISKQNTISTPETTDKVSATSIRKRKCEHLEDYILPKIANNVSVGNNKNLRVEIAGSSSVAFESHFSYELKYTNIQVKKMLDYHLIAHTKTFRELEFSVIKNWQPLAHDHTLLLSERIQANKENIITQLSNVKYKCNIYLKDIISYCIIANVKKSLRNTTESQAKNIFNTETVFSCLSIKKQATELSGATNDFEKTIESKLAYMLFMYWMTENADYVAEQLFSSYDYKRLLDFITGLNTTDILEYQMFERYYKLDCEFSEIGEDKIGNLNPIKCQQIKMIATVFNKIPNMKETINDYLPQSFTTFLNACDQDIASLDYFKSAIPD